MRRPGLLLPLVAVVLWVLLFFMLDYLAARKGGQQWIPAGSEWRVNVSVPPWAWRQGARVDAKEGSHATR